MCWCRSFSAVCPAFSLDSRLEETPPNFISYPRTLLLPEKSQKFPLFSILEVSICLLFNCRLWLSFCATWGLGFCLYRVSAKMLSPICPLKCYSVCCLFPWLLSADSMPWAEHDPCKPGCYYSQAQGEGTMHSLQPKTWTAVASQEHCWHHWDARVTSAPAGERTL